MFIFQMEEQIQLGFFCIYQVIKCRFFCIAPSEVILLCQGYDVSTKQ